MDSAFDAQMAYVDYLLKTWRDAVLAVDDCASDTVGDLLEHVIAAISIIDGYSVGADTVV